MLPVRSRQTDRHAGTRAAFHPGDCADTLIYVHVRGDGTH